MRKKVTGLAAATVMLGTAAILYRTLQPNTYRVEDIVSVYQSAKGRLTAEHEDYGGITIEYPLDETLFPP